MIKKQKNIFFTFLFLLFSNFNMTANSPAVTAHIDETDNVLQQEDAQNDLFLLQLYKNKEKQFLQQKLFIEPQEQSTLLGKLAQYCPTLLVGTLTFIYPLFTQIQYLLEQKDKLSYVQEYKYNTLIRYAIAATCTYSTYKTTNYFFSKPMNKKLNQKEAFKNFIENWSLYKDYTPTDLHSFFDAISQEYKLQENKNLYIKSIAPKALATIEKTLFKEKETLLESPTINQLTIANLLGLLTLSIIRIIDKAEDLGP